MEIMGEKECLRKPYKEGKRKYGGSKQIIYWNSIQKTPNISLVMLINLFTTTKKIQQSFH
jgi:hypothetical protein